MPITSATVSTVRLRVIDCCEARFSISTSITSYEALERATNASMETAAASIISGPLTVTSVAFVSFCSTKLP